MGTQCSIHQSTSTIASHLSYNKIKIKKTSDGHESVKMGVKVIALVALLAVSVLGQDSNVLDSTTKISDIVERVTEATLEDELITDAEAAPVEILNTTDQLHVRSGKYQAFDGLDEETPLEPANFGADTLQSERQLLSPSTTLETNNEYGKLDGIST